MKYKEGDKARVRSDLVEEQTYGNCSFVENMVAFRNEIITISRVHYGISRYQLEENLTGEYWTDEMLEDVEEEFKLPKKWCIKQCSDLKKWGKTSNLNPDKDFDSDRSYYWPTDESLRYWDFGGKGVREEITFDQLKKYVLKESESTPKFESKFVKGRWYKNPKWWSSPEDFCKFSGEFKGDLIGYTDKIIKGVPYFGSTGYWCNGDLCIEASAEEIQQYLPEGHPDKIKKRTKKVEDLKYPDVVHCVSKEQHDKINSFAGLTVYEGDKWYLTGAHGRDSKPYDEAGGKGYTNYEFSDIIFPEEKVEAKPMLSKEELLAEAKRRYPVGTRFCNSNIIKDCKLTVTVTGYKYYSNTNYTDDLLIDSDACDSPDKYSSYTIYLNGKWAEIISKQAVEKEVERLSFYVKYNTSFTEDLYDKLVDWCVKNNVYKTRGWNDTYKGLIDNGFFIYDSASLNEQGVYGYGVDNNRQNCINEYSVQQVKELIGYKEVLEQPREELVQTGLSQRKACESCKYASNCGAKIFSCKATGGQHYPKDYVPGSRTEGHMDGIPVSERLIIHTGNIGLLRGIYKIPTEPKDCFDSDEIYVPIIKTEVKQIKL